MKEIKSIDRKVILKNLCYEAEIIDKSFMDKIDLYEEELLSNIHPRYMCKSYDLVKEEGRVLLAECDLPLQGAKIANDLYYCKKAVLFCATLSGDIDLIIGLAGREDVEKAIILDGIAAAALEEYCDIVEADIAEKFPDYQITFRFSPSYGDLPEGSERDFTAVLDSERRIGVSYGENNMFTPRYSITALLGLMEK